MTNKPELCRLDRIVVRLLFLN